jgi:hypothetical protein
VTTKSDFSEEEWSRIVQAPFVAGLAISLADPSGPIEAAKESMATVKSATNPSSREQLVTEVALDIQAEVQQKRNPLKGYRSMYDYESVARCSITGSWSGGSEWDTSAEWQRGVGSAESDQPPPSDEDLASFRTPLEAQDTEAAAAADSPYHRPRRYVRSSTRTAHLHADSGPSHHEGSLKAPTRSFNWIALEGAFTATLGRTTAPACPFLDLW